jgi:hypothetical protein
MSDKHTPDQPKKKFPFPYIPDKELFKAVMFAWRLKKEHPKEIAISKSANYYKVDPASISTYWDQIEKNEQESDKTYIGELKNAGTSNHNKRRPYIDDDETPYF